MDSTEGCVVLEYTEEQRITILAKFGKTASDAIDDIKTVQDWLQTQPHLPEIADETVIEKFLMMNKFDVEKAKQKVNMYYVFRTTIPELFKQDPNSKEFQNRLETFYYFPLPKLTPDLHRVTVVQIKNDDVSVLDIVAHLAHSFNVAEIRLREDYRYKEIHVYDVQGIKLGHMTKLNPLIIKKLSLIMQKLYSHNLQSLNILNMPPFLHSFMYLLKSILKDKIEDRIIVHDSLESLHEIVPREILPQEFGGTAGTLAELNERWKRKFLECDALFRHLRNLSIDPDLLPEKLKIDDTFGVHGNFRKLDVD